MDDCDISDINFIRYVGELTKLSLGDNRLTDDSIVALLELSGENLSGLQELNLGKRVHLGIGGSSIVNLNSKNNITNILDISAGCSEKSPSPISNQLVAPFTGSVNRTAIKEIIDIPYNIGDNLIIIL